MRILIAEDEHDISKTYRTALATRGHDVTITEDGESCVTEYKKFFLQCFQSRPPLSAAADTVGTNTSNSLEGDDYDYFYTKDQTPFDVVILDYRMPKKDGLQVAKEVLEMCPHQRIIFASAYVKESLEESVKYLKRVVELLQKPFSTRVLVEAVEDQGANLGLRMLMKNVNKIQDIDNPSENDVSQLLAALKKIQKGRGF